VDGEKSMPRLVKGGKYVYGWSEVGSEGRVAVPDEALADYSLKPPCKVILLSGSRRSGGFALTTVALLKNSRLSVILDENPKLAGFQLPEGETIMITGKPCCWVTLNADGSIVVPLETLKEYGVNPGDHLLSVRGSCLALGFCVRGPLINEAKKHLNLKLFYYGALQHVDHFGYASKT
jgi:bifunctional DNA-binding transcriptional regulator/antitoxin component of YhaV-PrlF toxin-antitoxin module